MNGSCNSSQLQIYALEHKGRPKHDLQLLEGNLMFGLIVHTSLIFTDSCVRCDREKKTNLLALPR